MFERRVDTALQPVRGTGHRTALGQLVFEEREQPALTEQLLQSPVAASQLLMGPPPFLTRGLRIRRVVLRPRTFVDEVPPSDVPCIERPAPPGRGFGVMDLGEPVGELLELPAGLECFASMFVRQVRQCFSVVWADGFPRCRHRFPVM